QRDGKTPQERRDHEEQERQAGPERRHHVLDAVRTAADVEEHDGGQREEAELPPEPARHVFSTAAIKAGNSWSQASRGRAAGTVTWSCPLGSWRTRPGGEGPSGITSFSGWMPRASVRAKIASISFTVTTSSIRPRPPRSRTRGAGARSRRRAARQRRGARARAALRARRERGSPCCPAPAEPSARSRRAEPPGRGSRRPARSARERDR